MNKKIAPWVLAFLSVILLSLPVIAQPESSTPFVFGSPNFSQKFSPFYADTGYDMDVIEMTFSLLMTTDRVGGIIFNGINGETRPYNGTDYTYYGIADLSVNFDKDADITTYTAKLRNDLKFSDGQPVTADDIIFTYYVYLDPAYVGSTTLNSYKIIGLQDYLTQTTSEIYQKYAKIAEAIQAAGSDHIWAEGDEWTKEQQEAYWNLVKEGWMNEVQKIIDYAYNNFAADYAQEILGKTPEEVGSDEGLKTAFGMAMWGFGDIADGILTTKSGAEFDLNAGNKPTIDDFYKETFAAYAGDADAFFSVEATDVKAKSIVATAKDTFISEEGSKEPEMAAGIPNISGIKKVDDYTVEVKTYGYEAPAIYSILGIYVAPLHYYGDPAQYDYENNRFGHPYGDLSIIEAKTANPMGSGPYKFIKYDNRIVYFEANENFYLGKPKTQFVQFKETADNEMVEGVSTGTIDAASISGSKSTFESIAEHNSNKEITGDKITTFKVDNLGYGYIGINADTVKVGDDPASTESKNLRKALATVIAVYRDVAYDSYYGDAATVINYPISNTSWAAPQPTDPDYKVAFSEDVNGNPIYTSGMNPEEKYEAALEAAKGFLKAAGYTYDEATGKFTAAPEGASLTYEIIIPAGGTGDHPSFALVTDAANALAKIGITLKINDPADTNVLWDTLDAGKQNLWCAAWQATIDPDMYQVYHSSNIVGKGGSDSNHYHIADPELDKAIIEARQSDDQAYRKEIYKTALDIIVDWAVEIPAYQRQNSTIFSTERVKIDTVTPDITTFYDWNAEIQTLEMAQ